MTLTKTNIGLLTLFIAAGILLLGHSTSAETPTFLQEGDLVRGTSQSTVYYYGHDGMRYVFPNEKIYLSWYEDFEAIVWIGDEELTTIQIGGNVTYRPGVKMIKIQSDPKTYVVATNGTLRHIASQEIAEDLYGTSWQSKIDDLPDSFFGNYTIGSPIEFSSQYDPAIEITDASSINDDKALQPATIVEVGDYTYEEPTITINVGTAVRWIHTGENAQDVTEWNRVWGSGTLNTEEHFTRYFNETGTWHYYSKHQGKELMSGAIIVK